MSVVDHGFEPLQKTGVLGTNTDLLQSTDKYISYSCIEYSLERAGIESTNLRSDRYRGHTKTTIHKRVHAMLYFMYTYKWVCE
jgi:hypothetical protein